GDEFELYFQPLVFLETGALAGFEGLIRWNSPVHGPVGPDQFIRLAEEAGLIVAIGRWVAEAATHNLAAFQAARNGASGRRKNAQDLFVAINVTKHFLGDATFLVDLAANAAAHGLLPSQIKIELTESMLIDDHEAAIAWIARCKQLG